MKNTVCTSTRHLARPRWTGWLTCLLLLLCTTKVAHAGIGDFDANGWTILTPSADSNLVYVSSSEGNDANDGLSPATPKQTIDAANALIRDGYPDWMLLKRGDTFAEGNLGRWKSGRSAAEPLVLTYYGSTGQRPLIKLTKPLVDWNGQARNHTAYVGLDLYRSVSDPGSPDFNNTSTQMGLRFVPSANDAYNVLVEDCRLRFCGLLTQGSFATENFIYNAQHRRNIVADMWGHNTDESNAERPSGIFASKVVGLVLEENIFHHNGWNETVPDAGANQYNHNIYLSSFNDGPIVVRGNVLSYASGTGLQLRSGGTAEMNAFIGNSVGTNIGYFSAPTYYTGATVVRDNVITDGRPQVPNDTTEPQTGAIWGIWKLLVNNTTVDGNIVANILDNRGGFMVPFNGMTANELGFGNIAWSWVQQNDPATDPGWPDPARNAAGFATSLGLTDYLDWINRAMNREVGTMPFDLTAYSYNNYVRAGFGKGPVAAPYSYQPGLGDGSGPVAVTGVTVFPASLELVLGDSSTLAALVLPSSATDGSVTWTSDDPAIATVAPDGTVTAVAAGSASITATTTDGSFHASATITVTGLGENIALNRTVIASGGEDQAFRLVDGSTADVDSWFATPLPQWAEIDLGANYDISLLRLFPYQSRDYKYQIAIARDGSEDYEVIVDRLDNDQAKSVFIDGVSATGRYILLMVEGAESYNGLAAQINELEVYGTLSTGGSGSETFDNLNASTTALTSGTYTGDNGELWSYSSVRRIEDSGLEGVAAELRRNTGYVQTTLPDGLDELHLLIRTVGGLRNTSAKTLVILDGVQIGQFQPDEADTPKEIVITGLARTGPTLLRIQSGGSSEVWIDSISWSNGDTPPVAVTGVAVTPSLATAIVGSTLQLSATVSPVDAANQSVLWSTSAPTVAAVDVNGLVTAFGGGVATISATTVDGGFAASSTITVTVPVTGVAVAPASSTLHPGQTVQLAASVNPANASNPTVSWASNDPGVATVDAHGLVTAIASGSTTITVTTTDGGYVASSTITVTVPVTGVAIFPGSLDLAVGETATLGATISPADAFDPSVVWSSADPAVVTVDAQGLVTAVGIGSTTVSATTTDGGFVATAAITVNGTEGFDGLLAAAPAQTSDGSFTGVQGETWVFQNVQGVSNGITGASAQLKGHPGFSQNKRSYLQTTLPNGLSTLSFTLQAAEDNPFAGTGSIFTLSGAVLYINDVPQGVFGGLRIGQPLRVELSSLERAGPVEIRIEALGVGSFWVDDVTWTD